MFRRGLLATRFLAADQRRGVQREAREAIPTAEIESFRPGDGKWVFSEGLSASSFQSAH